MMAAASTIDPVIKAPPKAIDSELLIVLNKTSEPVLSFFRNPVPVLIFSIKYFTCAGHNHPITPGHDTGRKNHIINEHVPLVRTIVSISVNESSDAA
jgi:hypothetical protein